MNTPSFSSNCRRTWQPPAALGLTMSFLLVLAPFAGAGEVLDLHQQTVTFTNRQGRVYHQVQLERATDDGLIYATTNGVSVGMVRYADLPPAFLAGLHIPARMVTASVQRQAALARDTREYDAACQALARQQARDSQLAHSNALYQARLQPKVRPQTVHPPVQPKGVHHRRVHRRHRRR